jgi:cobalt-zinc-cadmium efflux system protein
MGGHHDHHHPRSTAGRLGLSSAIFALNMAVQAGGGLWTGSLGLYSDALENFSDAALNLLGMASLSVANRREPCDEFSYGWHRLEVFYVVVGILMLLALAATIVAEAVGRILHPHPILAGRALLFAGAGLVLNAAATLVLVPHGGTREERDLNLRSAYLHALGDSLTSLGVITSLAFVWWKGWRFLDPLMASIVVVVILRGAWGLARETYGILMHQAAFDHREAKAAIQALPGVAGVEDLRSWRLCSHLVICSAHVIVEADRLDETEAFLEDIEHLLWERFGVRHLTIHFETASMAERHHHRFIHQHESAGVEDPVHKGAHRHEHSHGHPHRHSHGS